MLSENRNVVLRRRPRIVLDPDLNKLLRQSVLFLPGKAVGDVMKGAYGYGWQVYDLAQEKRMPASVIIPYHEYDDGDPISQLRWEMIVSELRCDGRFDSIVRLRSKKLVDVLSRKFAPESISRLESHYEILFEMIVDLIGSSMVPEIDQERVDGTFIVGPSFRAGYEDVAQQNKPSVGFYPWQGIAFPRWLPVKQNEWFIDQIIERGWRVVILGDWGWERRVFRSRPARDIFEYEAAWEQLLLKLSRRPREEVLLLHQCADPLYIMGAAQACEVVVTYPTRSFVWFAIVHDHMLIFSHSDICWSPVAKWTGCHVDAFNTTDGNYKDRFEEALSIIEGSDRTRPAFGQRVLFSEID